VELDWIAEHTPTTPVNVMAQFHPDNFCDPGSSKYRDKYTEIARRPTSSTYDLRPKSPLEVTFGFYSPDITFCYPGGEGPLNTPPHGV
jgi:hypothetical protein